MQAEVGGASPDPPARPRAWWTRERAILAAMVVAFASISFYSGVVSFVNLQADNSTDLGIFMQAFSSTVRGHPAPFYESFDCLSKFRCSFLLVHPSPMLYGIVPVYALFPGPYTLYAFQSIGVALAALPLYGLARNATGSASKALVAAGLYLVWAPTLGGEAFSFHLESFLPLGILATAYLWQTGRYRLGLVAALATFLTIEVGPVFTFLLGAFFLYPYAASGFRLWRDRRAGTGRAPLRTSARFWWGRVRETLRGLEVRYTLLLMAASIAAYAVLYLFLNVFGAALLGVGAPPIPPGIGGVFFNNSTPGISPVSTTVMSSQTVLSLEFWIILYALAGFLPFFAPRSLILSVPWVGWTVLTDSSRFTTIGHQYSLVAAGPIFFGVAYGLARLPFRASAPRPAAVPDPPRTPRRSPRTRPAVVVAVTLLVGLVATNALLLPIDPALSDAGISLGAPFSPNYQSHTLLILPGFSDVEQLLGEIPNGAEVTAPAQLFPLLADRPNAIVLIPGAERENFTRLPGSLTNNPAFVVLYPGFYIGWKGPLKGNVSEPSMYGVRGYVASTSVGPILVYEYGYSGTPTQVGPPFSPYSASLYPGRGISAGGIGYVEPNATAPTGEVITNRAGMAGGVWRTPVTILPPGNYTASFLVSATYSNASLYHRATVLRLEMSGAGIPFSNLTVPASELSNGTWTNVTWTFTTPVPVIEFDLTGYLDVPTVRLSVGSVNIVPSGAS